MRYLLILIVTALAFSSCEERPVVIPGFMEPDSDRVVLIEEFSGVSCSNCPAGAAEVEKFRHDFPNNVVSVTFYTDLLGDLRQESKYELRTDESRALESSLGTLFAKPAVCVNRQPNPDESDEPFFYRRAEWLGLIETQLVDFSKLLLSAESVYDESNNKVNVTVTVTSKSDLSGDLSLVVLTTESHILDAQVFPGGVEELDYEHNHVFRKFLSEMEGMSIPSSLNANQAYQFSFDLDVDAEWVVDNMDIVAYVIEKNQVSTGNTEVLQAVEISVK